MEENIKNISITGLNRTQVDQNFETSRDAREETWCMSWHRNVPQRLLHICLAFCMYILPVHCVPDTIAAALQASGRFK
jgi:hypothetical protein